MDLNPLIAIAAALLAPFSSYLTWYLTKRSVRKEKKEEFEDKLIKALEEMRGKYLELSRQNSKLTIELHRLQLQLAKFERVQVEIFNKTV